MAKPSLPNEFNDLEPFAGWALPTERERNHKRINSQMSEIQALYDTMVPRMGAIMEYLNKLPIDGMPEDAQRLFHMTLSLAEVAPAASRHLLGSDLGRILAGREGVPDWVVRHPARCEKQHPFAQRGGIEADRRAQLA